MIHDDEEDPDGAEVWIWLILAAACLVVLR